jgi:hypothetical protein
VHYAFSQHSTASSLGFSHAQAIAIAEALKPLGYATGQFVTRR